MGEESFGCFRDLGGGFLVKFEGEGREFRSEVVVFID